MSGFRADRFATLHLFHPMHRLCARTSRIPILMYHNVSDQERVGGHPYYRTATSPAVFGEQLAFLRDNGYTSFSIQEAIDWAAGHRQEVERPVVITFDDGYEDFYTEAFPLLQRYGYSAIVYLPTAYIGATPQSFNGTRCLTWTQVRELARAGISFGSHTVTHPQLRLLEPMEMRDEIQQSKKAIENELGQSVESFSYPYAFPEADQEFKKRLHANLAESGYANGVSTSIGTADGANHRFSMRRLPVNSCDDVKLFKAKLEGGYDWLYTIQYISKIRPKVSKHAPLTDS